ncbi:MAG TPA: hypothetical protein VGG74_22385, partial [Kofleriaceae bacterium]
MGQLRRIGFRFLFVIAILLIWPFPFGAIPKTDKIAELLNKPWEWIVAWTAENVLGIAAPSTAPTGSGDTAWAWLQMAILIAIAVLATVVWSALDRRRTSYPRLAIGLEVGARYWLAFATLVYGLSKILPVQFSFPRAGRLDEHVGDMSPMGVLWTFMGSSRPYAIFAGSMESLGGVLLLWWRTRAIGAFVVAGVMTNVVVLNFCYDVPVKLYSMTLLLTALALLAPHARRVLTAMLAPQDGRISSKLERVKYGVKAALLVAMGFAAYQTIDGIGAAKPSSLDGIWQIDHLVVAGVDRPPLASDPVRWNKLLVAGGSCSLVPFVGDSKDGKLDEAKHELAFEHETWHVANDGD